MLAGASVPLEIQQLIAGIDQHIKTKTTFKASFKEIMKSEAPIAKLLTDGFK
jgi:hypothetical protein